MPFRADADHQLRNQLQIVGCVRGESDLASANLCSVLESLQDSLPLTFGPHCDPKIQIPVRDGIVPEILNRCLRPEEGSIPEWACSVSTELGVVRC